MDKSHYWDPVESSSDDDEFNTPSSPSQSSPRAIHHSHAHSIAAIRLGISDDEEEEPTLVTFATDSKDTDDEHSVNDARGSQHNSPTSAAVHRSAVTPSAVISATFVAPAIENVRTPRATASPLQFTNSLMPASSPLSQTPPPIPARKSSFTTHQAPATVISKPLPQTPTLTPAQSQPTTRSDFASVSSANFPTTTPLPVVTGVYGVGKTFSTTLTNHFAALSAQCAAGSYTCKRVASLLRKVAALEEEYATGLRKALAVEMSKAVRQRDGMPRCSQVWQSVQESLSSLASHHALTAQRTMEECVLPLVNEFATMEERRKELMAEERRCAADLARAQDDVNKQLAVCNKYLGQARIYAMDGDNINVTEPVIESATASSSSRPLIKSLTKHFRASAKAVNASTLKAAKSYTDMITAANHRQHRYNTQEMPHIYDGMQAMEQHRIALLSDRLQRFADTQLALTQHHTNAMNKIRHEAAMIDPERDIQHFIETCIASTPTSATTNAGTLSATLGQHFNAINNSHTTNAPPPAQSPGPLPSPTASSATSQPPFAYSLPYSLKDIEDGKFIHANHVASAVFGSSIDAILAAQAHSHPELPVPLIVDACITSILSHRGLESEGIFRLSIPKTELTAVRASVQHGNYAPVVEAREPHIPAAVLKDWMRALSEPVISDGLYSHALALVQHARFEPADSLQIFNQLKPSHQRVLEALAELSGAINRNEALNRMNFDNLAIVFAPCLLRNPSTDPLKLLEASKWECRFVAALLRCLEAQVSRERATSSVSQAPLSLDSIESIDLE